MAKEKWFFFNLPDNFTKLDLENLEFVTETLFYIYTAFFFEIL